MTQVSATRVVSPTTRLVSETSVLATILPSSIGLLTDIMYRLKGKDKPFSVLSAASESDMKELWLELEEIDQSLLFNEKHRKKDIPNFPQLVQFLSHCCQVRHYSFHDQEIWCFVMFTMQTCANATRSF